MTNTMTLRGGNCTGYIKNGQLIAEDSNGCLRRILLRALGVEESIDHRTENVFHLGHLSEELFEQDKLQGITYEKEKHVEHPITDKVKFSGHSDYVGERVYELKSATSYNTYKKVFTKGTPKISNVVQLCTYMLALEIPEGSLCYTSYTDVLDYKDMGGYTKEQVTSYANASIRETKFFTVTIDDDGGFELDGNSLDFNVDNLLQFQRTAADVLENEYIYPDRPASLETTMFNACTFCKLKPLCTDWETERFETTTFVSRAKQILGETK